MVTPLLIAAVVGYFLGAIPFGFLVARSKGVNIFEVGSKNPGATNVRRVLGAGPGNLVFALDALKGAIASGWILVLNATRPRSSEGMAFFASSDVLPMAVTGLIAALIGHSFSCFTHFKGGKGVATASGGLLALMPVVLVVSTVAWIVVFYASRYVSLASIIAAVLLPVTATLTHRPPIFIGITVAVMVFVVIRHRGNISRLMAGTESKFVKKKKPESGEQKL